MLYIVARGVAYWAIASTRELLVLEPEAAEVLVADQGVRLLGKEVLRAVATPRFAIKFEVLQEEHGAERDRDVLRGCEVHARRARLQLVPAQLECPLTSAAPS